MKPSYKKKIQSPFFFTFSKLTTYEASVQPLQSANYSMNRACDAWSWSFITGLFRAQKRLSVDLSHISTQYWDMTLLIFYLNQSGFTNQRINLPFSGQDQKRPLGGMVRRSVRDRAAKKRDKIDIFYHFFEAAVLDVQACSRRAEVLNR